MQEATSNTLIPCREESVDFESTQNLFIEAENLEALKILQKAYAGQVKMIYIDPPYNTGNDSFIYPDKFSETREQYARRVGDTDDNGYLQKDGLFQGALRKNAKDNGHYHSNWLNMMLPRLHLAKTLLADDGVIFISIDDNEQAQLKLLCDEVFGEENFVGEIIWKKKNVVQNDAKFFSTDHEYLLCYTKLSDKLVLNRLSRTEEQEARYQNPDNDPRGAWTSVALQAKSGSKTYEITFPNGVFWKPVSGTFPRLSKESLIQAYNENRLWFGKDGKNVPRLKKYLSEVKDGVLSNTVWLNELVGSTQIAKELVKRILNSNVFDTPKPVQYLSRMLQLTTDKNSLILDFFSGSGTTAHAVMQLNAEDGGNRRYICVQLPEETDEKSEAAKAGFQNIAEIAKERIRRAGAKIKNENPDKSIDTGFKVFKLAQSHFKQWQGSLKNIRHSDPERSDGEESFNHNGEILRLSAQNDGMGTAQNNGVVTARNDGLNSGSLKQSDWLENTLQQHTDTLLSDNTENIFYELLFRFGLRPTAEIIQDNGVYCVKDKGACFVFVIQAENADEAFFENILQTYQPMKIVVVEKVFNGKDDLKKNTALQIKDAKAMFVCV